MVEYVMDNIHVKRYVIWPLTKLLLAFAFMTILGVFLFSVAADNIFFVVSVTWIWIIATRLLPFFVLAHRHIGISKGVQFYADSDNQKFRYRVDQNEVLFGVDDISQVVCVLSPPKFEKRRDILGIGHFFFWKIVLKSGSVIRLSCLVVDEEIFFHNAIVREKKIFPFPAK